MPEHSEIPEREQRAARSSADADVPADVRAARIEEWILQRLAGPSGERPEQLDARQPLADLGLSSKDAVVVVGELREWLGEDLSPAVLWEHPTPRALARHLAGAADDAAPAPRAGQQTGGEPIAIIGLSCRFPGAENSEAFWDLLREGRDAVGDGTERRELLGDHLPHGLLHDVTGFDADLFSVSPLEASYADPQQRLLLETAWEAVEASGIAPSDLAGTRTGVFVGISHSDYGRLQEAPSMYSGTGQALSVAANRLSYVLDAKGPSLAVDTACSSSLVAVHQACRSLRSGESTTALAGGVNLLLRPHATDIFTQAGMLAPDGRCKTFDASADGYGRAEGCGVVVLKTLAAARRDGDPILAVIRGSAVNQDGRSNGLTAPSGPAQQAVVRDALDEAGVTADEIDYVEAHGTGTPLGDPVEIRSLSAVLATSRRTGRPVAIGSVKTNIGHAEAAAGIAGLIKVVLMLQHGRIAPHLHLKRLNPAIGETAGLTVPTRLTPWEAGPRPRTAGVSGFGFGGTNAHLIVQEPPAPPPPTAPGRRPARPLHLLALSAATEPALAALARRYTAHLADRDDSGLADICHSANTGRSPLTHRAVITASSVAEASRALEQLAAGGTGPGLITGRSRATGSGELAFLFTGQGSQYPGMARQLFETSPRFRREIIECGEVLAEYLELPLSELLFPDEEETENLLHHTRNTQPALFAVEYAMAQLWRSWGVEPGALLGHSVGELVAASVAGVFSRDDGLRLAAERGRIVQELTEAGAMALAVTDESAVLGAVDRLAPRHTVAVAAVNGDDNTVVSGTAEAVEAFRRYMTEHDVVTHPLSGSHAFHSPMMEPARASFARVLARMEFHAPRIPLISDLDGRPFDDTHRPDAAYWERHLTQTVRFAEGVRRLVGDGCTTFLETGPHPVLLGAVRRDAPRVRRLPSLRRGHEDWPVLAASVAELYTAGHPVDWKGFDEGYGRRRTPVPTYPFQHKHVWLPAGASPTPAPRHDTPTSEGPETVAVTSHTGAENHDPIVSSLSRTVTKLLGTDAPVDPDTPFLQLGTDSMMLLQMLQYTRRTFGVAPPTNLLFEEINTLSLLADYVRANADPRLMAEFLSSTAHAAPAPGAAQPVAGREAPAVPAGVPRPLDAGNAAEGAMSKFLDVHAQVMSQAYDLLRGSGTTVPPLEAADRSLPAGQPVASAAPAPANGAVPAVSAHTYVPFRPARAGTRESSETLTDSQQRYVDDLSRRHVERTRNSKEHNLHDRRHNADIRHAPRTDTLLRQAHYPITVTRSSGSRVWDLDGNEYIDVAMGFGVNLFGHNEPFIKEAIAEQLDRGMQLGPQPELAAEVARLIHEMTGNERIAFCNTGSEAVMTAVRLARAVTGRSKIVLFAGAYHGSSDLVLAQRDLTSDLGESLPLAPGITDGVSRDVLVLPYGEAASLDTIRERAGELAAVVVEPVQSRRPDLQPRAFLEELREITREAGTALVFDEVITGFRMHPRGVREIFGVEADITTYGKVLGGGLPIGVVAGAADYLDAIDGGVHAFGNGPRPGVVQTFFTGTFCKHPLALAASRAVLRELRRRGPGLQESVSRKVHRLADRVNEGFEASGVPIRVVHFGSLFRFRFPAVAARRPDVTELFHTALLHEGLYVWEGRNCFLSTAHTDDDLDTVIAAVLRVGSHLREAGFFPGPSTTGAGRDDTVRSEDTVRSDGGEGYPLSVVQQELWVLDQMGEDPSRAYNESLLLDLRGTLDLDALRACVREVAGRHEVLRTVFSPDGTEQRAAAAVAEDLPLVDLSTATDRAARDRSAAGWLDEQENAPYDLAAGPLMRAAVLRLAEDHHQLYLAAHHTVIDGWSFAVLLAEISELYAARLEGVRRTLPPPPRYRTYVERQRARVGTESWQADDAYWLDRFADGLPGLQLPTDRPRPSHVTYRGGTVSTPLDPGTAESVAATARKLGSTPFTVLLGAYAALLHRVTGQDDLVIGVPVAQREGEGEDRMVGNCSNLVPVRITFRPGTSVAAFLTGLHRTLLEAYAHSGHPISALRGRIPVGTDAARTQLFPTLFNLDQETQAPHFPGLTTDVITPARRWTPTEFEVDVRAISQGSTLDFKYNSDLFDERTVRRLAGLYRRLLRAFLSSQEQDLRHVSLVDDGERDVLLRAGHTAPPMPSTPAAGSVVELFEARAAATPDRVAVAHDGRRTGYRELNERANRLARRLRQEGVGPESRVGLLLARDTDLIVAVLAVWKAGGAHVALDPEGPPQRRARVVEDAGVSVILTLEGFRDRVPGGPLTTVYLDTEREAVDRLPADDLELPLPDSGLAYLVHTSGSTGRPKCVMVSHGSLRDRYLGWEDAYRLRDRVSSVLQMATFGFDVFVGDVVRALCSGAKLVFCPRDVLLQPAELLALMRGEEVDCAEFVPLVLNGLVNHVQASGETLGFMNVLIVGSDTVYGGDLDRALEAAGPDTLVVNSYGLAEDTVDTTYHVHRGGATTAGHHSPIGLPFPGSRVYILDDAFNPVPVGVPGMLYTAGTGLARGYLGRPGLTAERFVPNPWAIEPGERLYVTGDLARYRDTENGLVIEYLGRKDTQLKIRGYRIELGEVETAVEQVTGSDAVAVLPQVRDGDTRLVAYVRTAESGDLGPRTAQWHAALRDLLPDYMVPTSYVALEALPLTANGKLDRVALSAMEGVETGAGVEFVAPRTGTEARLAGIWAEVLGREEVGVHDDFFLLGGHSLLATRVVSRVREAFAAEVPIRWLFEVPTVAALAARLDEGGSETGSTRRPLTRVGRPRLLPLSYAQTRLWFLNRFDGESRAAYNIPMVLRLTGAVDAEALRGALADVVERHEVLRTRYVETEGVVVQQIVPVSQALPPLVTRTADPSEVDSLVAAASVEPFDVAADLPLRAWLFSLDEREHVLVLVLHHIAGDGSSLAPLARDVAVAYQARLAGGVPGWQSLPVQYADYTLWQREFLGEASDPESVLSAQLAYWRGALAGLPEELELPRDRPRQAVGSGRGGQVAYTIDAAVTERLREVGRDGGATLFMVLQAALAALLTRLGAGTDIPVGTPVAGRLDEKLTDVIGFFVNTLVLRADTSGDPRFDDLVVQVRETSLAAFAHQDVPFERLVEELNPVRSMGRHPLFQVMLALQNTPDVELELGDLRLSEESYRSTTSKFDLFFNLEEQSGGEVSGLLEYSTDLFDEGTAVSFVDRFTRLLAELSVRPGQR
ncbi:amino acid adenylation domain-containing protein, partial [Streptomyces sp. NPDC048224]|uniref:non-ribosomal peptide synthetase/type I polyketide synthase n=1 Tax=Streptomyces sp. NPDC048224 TaxID=3154500 RepID=UPI0033F13620